LSSLGDVFLTFPALAAAARAFGRPVAVATRAAYAALFKRHPAVDTVLTLPAREVKGKDGVAAVVARINEETKPDVVLDWHGVPLARAIAARVAAETKVRYSKLGARRALLATTRLDFLPRPTIRVPELYVRTLKAWGVTAPDWSFRLDQDLGAAVRLRNTLGITGGAVALAPGARWETKAWPAEHWRALAEKLAAAGRRILVVGSGSEVALCASVAAGLKGAVNAAGKTRDPAELPELLRGAALLVTNDSALAHLAPLVDVPALALFGPTSPRFGFAPWGTDDRVLYLGLECSPCSRHGAAPCWRSERQCLTALTPARVYAAAEEMLGGA